VLNNVEDDGTVLIQIMGARDAAFFLYRQRLHSLWLELLENNGSRQETAELHLELIKLTKLQVAKELPQQRVMAVAHDILVQQEIPYFFAKGANLREVLYEKPQLRPACDMDLFVPEVNKQAVTNLFEESGFIASPDPATLSHELKLTLHGVDIDLHWSLFRPGRARPGLLDWLFKHREKFGDYWGLDTTASLLVMLVHPAITKYLLSPTSMLIHQVDQARLVRSGDVDWEELDQALKRYGLKTAAWSSLYVLRELGDVHTPPEFETRLRPGRVKEAYLKTWIDRAWITRWFEKRWLVAGFFSLALQDSMGDVIRALINRRVKKSDQIVLAKPNIS
jgi:hypothetical protein